MSEDRLAAAPTRAYSPARQRAPTSPVQGECHQRVHSTSPRVNDDKEHAEEAIKTMGFVPEWVAGADTNTAVRAALALPPEMRAFIADYVRRAVK